MKFKIAIPLALSTLILTACSSVPIEPNVEDAMKSGGAYTKDIKIESPNLEANLDKKENLKILSNYSVNIETKNLEVDSNLLKEKAHSYGGYVSSNEVQTKKSGSSQKETTLSIKVAKKYASDFNSYLKENFKVSGEKTASVDVSNEYESLKSKIKTIEEREERLQSTYDSSEKVDDLFSLDERLSKLSMEKEDLQRELNNISTRLEYFKVDISIKEVSKFTVGEEKGAVEKEFSSGMKTIGKVFSSISVFLVSLMPFTVFTLLSIALAGLGFIGVLALKKRYNKKKKNQWNSLTLSSEFDNI